MTRDAQPGHVYLVGAGPGDPDLLTVAALHLLQTASHILPDGLVSDDILDLASPTAVILPVGKRCGAPRVTQLEINTLLVSLAHEGASVVRLKSGDPLVFGRAAEEMAALTAANIPFEVVPGISAAFAAAASLRTTLTDRTSASKVILATAHHAKNSRELDPDPQSIWSGALPEDATLVLYMPGPDLESLAHQLISNGIAPETPVAAVSRVSSTAEHTHRATLATLRSQHCGPAPVLLLIGRPLAPIS